MVPGGRDYTVYNDCGLKEATKRVRTLLDLSIDVVAEECLIFLDYFPHLKNFYYCLCRGDLPWESTTWCAAPGVMRCESATVHELASGVPTASRSLFCRATPELMGQEAKVPRGGIIRGAAAALQHKRAPEDEGWKPLPMVSFDGKKAITMYDDIAGGKVPRCRGRAAAGGDGREDRHTRIIVGRSDRGIFKLDEKEI